MFKLKKGFPHKIFGKPYGWQDLGEDKRIFKKLLPKKEWETTQINGLEFTERYKYRYVGHPFCNSKYNLAREGEEFFYFCPRCLKKANYNEELIRQLKKEGYE